MPDYITIPWLIRQWSEKELMNLSATEIAMKQGEVQRIASENERIYKAARDAQVKARNEWNNEHPRAKQYPSFLRRPIKHPPNIRDRWNYLLGRRDKAFRAIQRQKEAKRDTFVDRMETGRFRAMQRRETAIRQLINRYAKQHGIELTATSIDKRVEELIEELFEVGCKG